MRCALVWTFKLKKNSQKSAEVEVRLGAKLVEAKISPILKLKFKRALKSPDSINETKKRADYVF